MMNKILNYLRGLHDKYGDIVGFVVAFFFLMGLWIGMLTIIALFAFIMYINLDVAIFLLFVAIFYIITKEEKFE